MYVVSAHLNALDLGVACLIARQKMSVKQSSELIYVRLVKEIVSSGMSLESIKIQGKLILLPQMPLLNLQVKAVVIPTHQKSNFLYGLAKISSQNFLEFLYYIKLIIFK